MIDEQDALQGQAGHDEQSQSENHETMESLMRSEDAGLEFPIQGEIRQGVIASISASQILVSVGSKSEGVIMGRELEQIPTSDREALAVGQEIPVYVITPRTRTGMLFSPTPAPAKQWVGNWSRRCKKAAKPLKARSMAITRAA
jgi:small subunit ribosomal protein S1